jgi:hypothetical protein
MFIIKILWDLKHDFITFVIFLAFNYIKYKYIFLIYFNNNEI